MASLHMNTLGKLLRKLDLATREAYRYPKHSIERIRALASIQNIQKAIAELMTNPFADIALQLVY